jgi:hypothetical protein
MACITEQLRWLARDLLDVHDVRPGELVGPQQRHRERSVDRRQAARIGHDRHLLVGEQPENTHLGGSNPGDLGPHVIARPILERLDRHREIGAVERSLGLWQVGVNPDRDLDRVGVAELRLVLEELGTHRAELRDARSALAGPELVRELDDAVLVDHVRARVS